MLSREWRRCTSELSTKLLPTKVRLTLETWRYGRWYFELTTPIARLYGQDMSIYTNIDGITVKPVCNDHIYNKNYYLWFIP